MVKVYPQNTVRGFQKRLFVKTIELTGEIEKLMCSETKCCFCYIVLFFGKNSTSVT